MNASTMFERATTPSANENATPHRGVTSAPQFITPQMAGEMLASNSSNRKVIRSHLRRLEGVFRRGEMILNGDAIRVSVTGVLLDGQHRLLACLNTGIGFWTLVVRGLPDEVFDTIDQTKAPRRISCVMSMQGERNVRTLSAAVTQLHAFMETGQFYNGGISRLGLTAHAARGLLDRHPEIRTSVDAFQSKANYVWRTSTPAVLHYLFSIVDARLAEDFREVVITGGGGGRRPFHQFRESLIKARAIGKMRLRHDAARAIRAFNYERAGETPKLLLWLDSMDFPAIDGLDIKSL